MILLESNQTTILSLLKDEPEALRTFLCESDFFTAPCSRSHHLAERGGLAQHSLNVYYELDKLDDFVRPVVSLCHDLCKANFYGIEKANRKINPQDSRSGWESYDRYCVKDQNPIGHGEKSVILLLRLGVQLSDDEIAAIRWHMGAWDVQGNYGAAAALSAAQAKWPLVTLLHVADMMAAHIVERSDA